MTTETAVAKRPESEMVQAERTRNRPTFCPVVDIVETPDELLVVADIPGARADDIDVQFENGTLTLDAKVCDQRQERGGFLMQEYGVGDYHRTFKVSETIDASRINAEFRAGVLTLHLPKTEAAKPRKIAVKAE